MVKSIYGAGDAPRKWGEHLFKALRKLKLKQSENDPCLWFGPGLIIIIYCDDLGLGSASPEIADKFIKQIKELGFELTVESSFSEYLGIQIERDDKNKTITMTQPGLTQKIIETTNMEGSHPQATPAKKECLGKDPDGEPFEEEWTLPQVNGMLLYLSCNTRPDLAYSVSQTSRFNHCPKKSHAVAIKKIVRYLKGTADKGIVVKVRKSLDIQVFVDSDFAGLYKQDPDAEPSSAKSRMGYIIFLGGFPLYWKSKLTQEICLSTSEAEYSALSQCLRDLIPIRRTVIEVARVLNVSEELKKSIITTIHEDNDACRLLATNQHLTSRTKYFHVKHHFFWGWIKENEDTVSIVRVDTKQQRADYLTKGLPREVFEAIRLLAQGW